MPKKVDRDAMQRAILAAALRAFSAKGYHAATIADVAAAAGLGKGTLYLYFKNKEAIAEAMVDRHFAAIEARITQAPAPDTIDAFVETLSEGMDIPEDEAAFIRVYFEVFGPSFASDSFAARVAGFFDRLGAHYARTLARLQDRGAVRADLDPAATGRALAGMLDGMVLHRGLFGIDATRHAGLREASAALVLRGLAA